MASGSVSYGYEMYSRNTGLRPEPTQRRQLAVVALSVLLVAAVWLFGVPVAVGEVLQSRVAGSASLIISTQVIVSVVLILFLERRYPAQPNQQVISPSLLMDGFYFFVMQPVFSVGIVLISGPLQALLERYASWMVLDVASGLPLVVAVPLGIVLVDVTSWATHITQHKIPFLWRFHMVHHSQPNMNMFTAARLHPVSQFLEGFVMRIFPFFILFPSVANDWKSLTFISALYHLQLRFQHSNIKTNLGPLRYLIVTPQSHRVHHSVDPVHWNSNYASIFAWDRLFGTQHPDDEVYPITGTPDRYVPEPSRWSLSEFARCLYRQTVFPFTAGAGSKGHLTGSGTESAV